MTGPPEAQSIFASDSNLDVTAAALIVDNRKHITVAAAAASHRQRQPGKGKGQQEVRDKAHIALH